MTHPLLRAFAALAVPVLRPLADALAEEWTRDDEDEEIVVQAKGPVGFVKPSGDPDC